MNIEERIAEACENVYPSIMGQDRFSIAKRIGFETGFRACLASLYPEVRAEELVNGAFYQAQWDNGKREDWTIVQATRRSEELIDLWITGDEREVEVYNFRSFRGPILTPDEVGGWIR